MFSNNEGNLHLNMLNSMEAVIVLYIKVSEFIAKNRINEIFVTITDQVNVKILIKMPHFIAFHLILTLHIFINVLECQYF